MNSLDLEVTGMTCMSCATTIKNLLLRYEYVEDVQINIIMNKVKVILNKKISLDERKKICDTINNAGFICLLKAGTIMSDMLTLSMDDADSENKSSESLGSEILVGNSKDIAEKIVNDKNVKLLKLQQIPLEEIKNIIRLLENKTGIITIISYMKWDQICILFDESKIDLIQIQDILNNSNINILSYIKFYCLFDKDKLTCINNLKIKTIFCLNSDKNGINLFQRIYNCLIRRRANIEFNKDFNTSINCYINGLFGIYNIYVEKMNENNWDKNLVLIINIEYNPYFISGRNLLKYMNEEVLENYINNDNLSKKTDEEEVKKYSHKLVYSEQVVVNNNLNENINYLKLQKSKDKESRYYVTCFTISLILTSIVLMLNFFGNKEFMSRIVKIMTFNIVKSLNGQSIFPGINCNYFVTLLLVTIIVYLCGYTFHIKGIQSIMNLSPNMYTLISLSTNTCYIYSIYMILYISIISSNKDLSRIYSDKLPNFFDIACMLTTISLFGRILDIHSNLLILKIINKNNETSEFNKYNINDKFQVINNMKFESLNKIYYQFSNYNSQVLPTFKSNKNYVANSFNKIEQFNNKIVFDHNNKNYDYDYNQNVQIDNQYKMNTTSFDNENLDKISIQSLEMKEESSTFQTVNIDLIDLGDTIFLKKDDIVPYDGILVSNQISIVDESLITGETRIIEKLYGNFITSGSRVLSDNLIIYITEIGTESTLGKIQKLKNKAKENQIQLPGAIDKFSKYFVPFILSLSPICFIIWFLLAYYDIVSPESIINADRIDFFMGFNDIFQQFPIASKIMFGLHFSLSVLAISCPCVIGITVPIAVLISTSLTSKKNILVQNTNVFNMIGYMNYVVFDKTGTLTNGKPAVKSIVLDHESINELSGKDLEHIVDKYIYTNDQENAEKLTKMAAEIFYINKNFNHDKLIDDQELFESYLKLWWIIGSCEYYNNHPAGNALKSFSIQLFNHNENLSFIQPNNCKYIPGIGMTCLINNMKILITNQYKYLNQDYQLTSLDSTSNNHYLKNSSNTLEISINNFERNSLKTSLHIQNWLKYWTKKGSMIIYIFSDILSTDQDEKQDSNYNYNAINVNNMKLLGAISMTDEPMFGVESTINYIKKFITDQIWLCSGDSFYTSSSIASMVGIDNDKIMSNSTPNDKLLLIQDLQTNKDLSKTINIDFNHENNDLFKTLEIDSSENQQNYPLKTSKNISKTKKNKVMMIGDGINDSASIEAADVGILLGKGGINNFTHADVIILSNYQYNLKFLFKLARETQKVINRNLVWAFIFNLLTIPIAAGVFYPNIIISPVVASFLMLLSSTIIVFSSLVLYKFR